MIIDIIAGASPNFSEDTIRVLDNDPAFDKTFKLYESEKDLLFLRGVDTLPIIMKETELLKIINELNTIVGVRSNIIKIAPLIEEFGKESNLIKK